MGIGHGQERLSMCYGRAGGRFASDSSFVAQTRSVKKISSFMAQVHGPLRRAALRLPHPHNRADTQAALTNSPKPPAKSPPRPRKPRPAGAFPTATPTRAAGKASTATALAVAAVAAHVVGAVELGADVAVVSLACSLHDTNTSLKPPGRTFSWRPRRTWRIPRRPRWLHERR